VIQFCSLNSEPCTCDDAEMQPCLAVIIGRYCSALWGSDPWSAYACQSDFERIFQTYSSWDEFKPDFEGPSC